MDHLEIHNLIESIVVKSVEKQNTMRFEKMWSVKALEYAMLGVCINGIMTSLLVLKAQQNFCLSCLYLNLSNTRKAIHRYLMIENQAVQVNNDGDNTRLILTEAKDVLNNVCLEIKKELNNYLGVEHHKVKNNAFDQINKPPFG